MTVREEKRYIIPHGFGLLIPDGDEKALPAIFERIPTTRDICKREGNHSTSVWWNGCREANCKKGNENYEKGRKELMEKFGL